MDHICILVLEVDCVCEAGIKGAKDWELGCLRDGGISSTSLCSVVGKASTLFRGSVDGQDLGASRSKVE